jgi:hypothetical protein
MYPREMKHVILGWMSLTSSEAFVLQLFSPQSPNELPKCAILPGGANETNDLTIELKIIKWTHQKQRGWRKAHGSTKRTNQNHSSPQTVNIVNQEFNSNKKHHSKVNFTGNVGIATNNPPQRTLPNPSWVQI